MSRRRGATKKVVPAVAASVLLVFLTLVSPAVSASAADPGGASGPEAEDQPIERIEAQPLTAVDARSAALLLSGESGGDFEGAIVWTSAGPSAGGRESIRVFVEIDGVGLLAGSAGSRQTVEVFFYVVDDSGDVVGHLAQSMSLDGIEYLARVRETGLKFVADFQLARGLYSVRTLIRNRDGARLRYRLSYRDSEPADGTADRTLVAGMLGVAENPFGITLEVQEQEAREDGNFLVPIMIRIPIGELVLLPEEGRHQAQISVYSVIFDEAGRSSKVHERAYPIEIENDQLLSAVEQEAKFVVGVVLEQGPHRIAVTVRDDRSSSESTAVVDVAVGDTEVAE